MEREYACLIVEDDTIEAAITGREMKKAGMPVFAVVVDDAEHMRRALQEYVFDFIISDHNMPVFNSLEALKIRNELAPATPFVILTNFMPVDAQEEAARLGCSSILNKNYVDLLPRLLHAAAAEPGIREEG